MLKIYAELNANMTYALHDLNYHVAELNASIIQCNLKKGKTHKRFKSN